MTIDGDTAAASPAEAGPPDVTCRSCGSLDWARDGFGLRAEWPRIEVERFAPPSGAEADEPWTCRSCGQRLDDEAVAGALSQLALVHWE